MGSCIQGRLQVFILTFELGRNVFSLVHFSFERFDALREIDCFRQQVFLLVSQLLNLHQKFRLFFSGLVGSVVVRLQVFDLLL